MFVFRDREKWTQFHSLDLGPLEFCLKLTTQKSETRIDAAGSLPLITTWTTFQVDMLTYAAMPALLPAPLWIPLHRAPPLAPSVTYPVCAGEELRVKSSPACDAHIDWSKSINIYVEIEIIIIIIQTCSM